MRPPSFHAWQQAEHEARGAALALQTELAMPGKIPPDAMFVDLRRLRQRATDILCELTLHYARESVRVWRIAA